MEQIIVCKKVEIIHSVWLGFCIGLGIFLFSITLGIVVFLINVLLIGGLFSLF